MLTPSLPPRAVAAKANRPAPPDGHRWEQKLEKGFTPLALHTVTAAYHRLRATGLTHTRALTVLGEWIVLIVRAADYATGKIVAGGKHAGDRTGYRHRLLTPASWPKRTLPALVAAGLVEVADDPAKPVVTGIPDTWFTALTATTRTGPDGTPVGVRFVPLNRAATRDFVVELRGRNIGGRGRLLATLVLLAGHTNAEGYLTASQRELAAELKVSPSRVHNMIDAVVTAGYAQRGDSRRTSKAVDEDTALKLGDVRDRLNGRTWELVKLADESPAGCSEIVREGAPELPPTGGESTSREGSSTHLGSSGPRTSRPRRVARGGAKGPGWKVGPATAPDYAVWTARCVDALALNLPALR